MSCIQFVIIVLHPANMDFSVRKFLTYWSHLGLALFVEHFPFMLRGARSSVGCRLDTQALIPSSDKRLLSKASRLALEPTQPPVQWSVYQGLLFQG
jgi:hypothetical protein